MSNEYKPREWQEKAKISEQLSRLMTEYAMRKSKLIKYVPTEKELREAVRMYRFILESVDEKDPNALKLKEILDSISDIPEEQIKFVGFMNELFPKYPTGEVPHQVVMDTAEKWDVLEYIVEDIIRVLGIKLKKLR